MTMQIAVACILVGAARAYSATGAPLLPKTTGKDISHVLAAIAFMCVSLLMKPAEIMSRIKNHQNPFTRKSDDDGVEFLEALVTMTLAVVQTTQWLHKLRA